MLTFSSSLAMCLAMGNAFVFRAPNVAPSKSARGNQADVIAPLGATSRGLGTGGVLARFSDNDDMEGEQHLPRVPAEGCYRGWGSRAICPPLHASKGVEPDIIQDGNTTIPIAGQVGGADGEDPGVDESLATVLSTQEEDDDSTHGTINKEDADLPTDADTDTENPTQASREGVLDAVDDEGLRITTDGTATDEETNSLPFGPAVVDSEVVDVVGPMLDNSDENAFDTDRPSDLVDESVIEEIFLKIFDNLIIKDGDDSPLSFTLEEILNGRESSKQSKPVTFNDPLDDLIKSVMLNDFVGDATASEELMLDDAVCVLIRSVLRGAVGNETPSWNRLLDNDLDGVMLKKIHRVLYGRVEVAFVNAENFLYSMLATTLHDAFFGPAAIKAVKTFTNNADNSEVVVQNYVRVVSRVYDKLEEVRDHTIGDKECRYDLAAANVFDELSLRPFVSLILDDWIDDDVMGSMLHGIDGSSFEEMQRLDTTPDGVGDGIRLGPFGPVISVDAVNDVKLPLLPHHFSDRETSVVLEKAAYDLVMSVVEDAMASVAPSDLVLDDDMDGFMWNKLYHAISVSGRAASEPCFDLGDALDAVSTSLLHKAFFGPTASKAIASLAENTDSSEAVVKDYVQAVSKLYDNFREAKICNPTPDKQAPVVRRAMKGGWTWARKLWRRDRRNGE